MTRYVLEAPFEIGPRLMPSVRLDDGSRVSMAADRVQDGRVYWRYTIDDTDGTELLDAADIGCGQDTNHKEAFATLASFLGAAQERIQWELHNGPTGESSLFPESLTPWIEANAEEFWLMFAEEDD